MMNKEGSTDGRGWDIGQVSELMVDEQHPKKLIKRLYFTFMQPRDKSWAGKWEDKKLEHIISPGGRYEWWQVVDPCVIKWSFELTKGGKVPANKKQLLRTYCRLIEDYHERGETMENFSLPTTIDTNDGDEEE
jgi:hypothetical protein